MGAYYSFLVILSSVGHINDAGGSRKNMFFSRNVVFGKGKSLRWGVKKNEHVDPSSKEEPVLLVLSSILEKQNQSSYDGTNGTREDDLKTVEDYLVNENLPDKAVQSVSDGYWMNIVSKKAA